MMPEHDESRVVIIEVPEIPEPKPLKAHIVEAETPRPDSLEVSTGELGVLPIRTYLPEQIKSIRQRNGYTQQEFADICGVKKSTIAKWESGQSRPSRSASRVLEALQYYPHIFSNPPIIYK